MAGIESKTQNAAGDVPMQPRGRGGGTSRARTLDGHAKAGEEKKRESDNQDAKGSPEEKVQKTEAEKGAQALADAADGGVAVGVPIVPFRQG